MTPSTSKTPYRAGDKIRVRLVEWISDEAWIASLDGKLLQIRNRSDREFQEDQEVWVKVESGNPLVLSLQK